MALISPQDYVLGYSQPSLRDWSHVAHVYPGLAGLG
jgi:hypothetical protein